MEVSLSCEHVVRGGRNPEVSLALVWESEKRGGVEVEGRIRGAARGQMGLGKEILLL